MEKEKKLFKNTIIFMIGSFGSKILMLLIVPVYTYFLSTDEMGIYDVTITGVDLLKPLIILSIYDGIYRWLLDDNEKNIDVLKSGYNIIFKCLLSVDLGCLILNYFINFRDFFIVFMLINTGCLYISLQYTTRGLRNIVSFSLQGIIYTISLCISNVVLICILNLGHVGLLWSIVIANSIAIIYMLIAQPIIIKMKRGKVNRRLTFDMAKYSIMLVPNGINWWIMSASARVFIIMFIGTSANGIYAIANKFPSIIQMLSEVFYQAWQEQAIEEYSGEERDRYYTNIFSKYSILLLSGIIILIPLTKIIIILFMHKDYHSACEYVPFLYIASVFSAFSGFYGTGYLSAKDTKGAMTTTIYGSIVSIILSFLLIRLIGIQGASISTMLANLIVWLARIKQTKKYFLININWLNPLLLILVSVIYGIVLDYVNTIGLIIMGIVATILFIVLNKDLINALIKMTREKIGKR